MDYDLGIIGAGAAGLHLLHAMLDDPFFRDKRILVVEKEHKTENDRTWCFWELETGRWDDLVSHSWGEGKFITNREDVTFRLHPYRYKMIRSEDFYAAGKERVRQSDNVDWVQAEVRSVGVVEGLPVILLENGTQLTTGYLFDSRVDKRFYQDEQTGYRIWQHFKGWVVESEEDLFTPETFTMMDFRLRHPGTTSFTYILPFTPKRALVEFTFFSPDIVGESVYDEYLRKYMDGILGGSAYRVTDTESGVIPMTDYPFHRISSGRHLRIGTAGSWVKPSSGYSFKNAERKARQVVANLKAGRDPGWHLLNARHRFYDTLFLDRLYRDNAHGEQLFEVMYTRNDIQSIFRFLDEETSFSEELSVMKTFPPGPFMGAIWRNVMHQLFPVT